MKTSAGEDLLEAACLFLGREKSMPTIRDIAGQLSRDPDRIREDALQLENGGYLRLKDGDVIELSEKGLETGSRTMKKHRVLECFLSEILGMERTAASEEACILEHDISDETLDRLEGFMVLPNGHRKRLQGGHRKIQSLVDFPGGTELKVVTIRYQDGCERLSDLGIVPGEIIHLVNVLPQKAVVVKVKGCDIALSPEIASSILVESLQ